MKREAAFDRKNRKNDTSRDLDEVSFVTISD
jgi:hypothetical protein